MDDIVNLIMNAGVTIVIIAYFIFRDYKFMSSLQTTLTTLVDTVNTLKEIVTREEKNMEGRAEHGIKSGIGWR